MIKVKWVAELQAFGLRVSLAAGVEVALCPVCLPRRLILVLLWSSAWFVIE